MLFHCSSINCLHYFTQVTAVFAADAVARLSGVVGVAAVTAGPGRRAYSCISLVLVILTANALTRLQSNATGNLLVFFFLSSFRCKI